ncbi:MAG: hypothetical protein KDA33_00030, partial [Phycisphaerales bacterium]|nr:hypothetical protein [Phycisphaerales bacterium]
DARGDADGAARHARVVAQIGATDEAVQERAGVVLANARAYEDAVAVLKPVIDRYMNRGAADDKSTPDAQARPTEAIHSFARSCIELNRDEEAMRVLKAAIREDSSDQVTWSLYCRAAIRAGNLDMALEIVSTFNRRNKPIPEMLVLEAYVYFLRGDLARARETADQALKIDPGFEAAFILKAKASNDARSRPAPIPARPRIRETLAPAETRRDAVVRSDAPANTRQWYLHDPRAASRVAIVEEDDGR